MTTSTHQSTCPIDGCGAPTRQAFAKTTDYVTCTRNGHVTRSSDNPATNRPTR